MYSHGEYYLLGEKLGTFGYSVRKTTQKPHKTNKRSEKLHKKSSASEKKLDGRRKNQYDKYK